MLFNVKCSNCGAMLRIDSNRINPQNPQIRCPKCKNIFGVKIPEEKTKIYAGQESEKALAWLVVHDENVKNQTYSLKKGKQVVGRKSISKPCEIMIECNDEYISRNHCEIEVREQNGRIEVLLSDNKSTNGTWINAKEKVKLGKTEKLYLQDNDMLQIGMTKIVLKIKQGKINSKEKAIKEVVNRPYGETRILDL